MPVATVDAVNEAVFLPAATKTLAGTTTPDWSLRNVTTTPPVGAISVNVTVPEADPPPSTLVGLNDTDFTFITFT